MNKTKILTSLSALAAVCVFNGNAMAGTYAPSCNPNVYKITVENSADGYYQPGDTVCGGTGNTCTSGQCPAEGTEYTITYGLVGDLVSIVRVPTADCNYNPAVTLESYSLYNESGVAVVSDLELGSVLTYEVFEKSDGTVLPGGNYTLEPKFSDVNTYNLVFDCRNANTLPGGPQTEDTRPSYTAGSTIGLADVCQLPGYDVTFTVSGMDHTGVFVEGRKITDDKVEGFRDGSTVTIKAAYTPKCVGVRFYKTSEKGPTTPQVDYEVIYFKNPANRDSKGAFYSDNTCMTAVNTSFPMAISGYTVRGYIRTTDPRLCKINDYHTDSDITTALNTANWNAVKPSGAPDVEVGQVLDSVAMYCAALAKNCFVPEDSHALCELDVSSDGKVTYTNCCKAGYNNEDLGSTTLNATSCGN